MSQQQIEEQAWGAEMEAAMAKDPNFRQVGGNHYKRGKMQPWDVIDAFKLNFYEGNAVKYILRKKDKRVEDLQKAIHYLEKEIANITKLERFENEQKKRRAMALAQAEAQKRKHQTTEATVHTGPGANRIPVPDRRG